MQTMSISLPDSMRTYIEQQIAKGNYSTASEYFSELVRQDQMRKSSEHLEVLLLEGLKSGNATVMSDHDWEEIRNAVREKVTKRQESSKR